jgi:hypothetical protein
VPAVLGKLGVQPGVVLQRRADAEQWSHRRRAPTVAPPLLHSPSTVLTHC